MNHNEQRRWLAEQAARCMSELAIDDPMKALRRVLGRQRRTIDRRQWPEPDEIRASLRAYQRLFRGPEQGAHLDVRRQAAIEAMRFFAPFHPVLVGAVLDGTADAHSPVQLHLHGDDPEALLLFLDRHGIAHDTGERRIHLSPQRVAAVPHLTLDADGIGFELWLLPSTSERQPPLANDGRTPIPRATPAAVMRLGRND